MQLRVTKTLMLAVFSFSTFCTANVSGLNGTLVHAFGPRSIAMGGANGAAPVDISTITCNPAGLTRLSTRADFGANLIDLSSWIDGTHATGPAINTAAGRQHGILKYYVHPFTGMIYHPECSNWSFGASSVALASGGVTYKKPIIKPELLFTPNGQTVAETGAIFDTSASAYILQTGFAAAYQWSDCLSLGATFNINTFLFSTDSPKSTPDGLKQTKGRGRLDVSYGVGLTLGGLYTINDQWSAGLTLITPQYFEKSKLYGDIIPKFRLPPEARLGLAYRPFCPLLITMDLSWLGWGQVRPFKTSPDKGGFGWKDQCAIGLGLQYNLNSAWIFRAGYNYGKATIKSKTLFANALFPIHVEHHLDAGVEFFLNENNSFVFTVEYELRNTIKESGKGGQVSQLGKGLKSSTQGTVFSTCWSILF